MRNIPHSQHNGNSNTIPVVSLKIILHACFLTAGLLCTMHMLAREPMKFKSGTKQPSFIENRGQVTDQYGGPRSDIQFTLTAANGLSIFISNGAIHYQFSRYFATEISSADTLAPFYMDSEIPLIDSVTMYRMDVELVGANPGAELIKEKKLPYYENHFTHGLKGAAAHACAWTRLTYKNVYPGIDWVLCVKNGMLKHEFVVHKGADATRIKIQYGGATHLEIDKRGALVAATPQGTITEQPPVAWQDNGEAVACSFLLHDSILSYATPGGKDALTIDPDISWATYFGGAGYDEILGLTTDPDGSVTVTGETQSTSGIATTGAYQASIVPGPSGAIYRDVFCARYSPSGSLLWSTYYGSFGTDNGNAICTDDSGYIYIAGNTTSPAAFATTGIYQDSLAGFYDAFIAKFDSSGWLVWCTYFGGGNFDVANSIASDGAGNIIITGETESTYMISSPGAYQSSFSGYADMFVAKFTNSGSRVWSTYLGGASNDIGWGVTCGSGGSVYLVGSTQSIGMATPGAHQVYGGGVADGLLAKFSASGNLAWSTYYGGNLQESINTVCFSGGFVYVGGYTLSGNNIATPGAFQPLLGGYSDGFLAKFTEAGTLLWGTYFGSTGDEGFSAVSADGLGGLYLTGSTTSTSLATPGATQETYGGGDHDAFVVKFSDSCYRIWCTYYGGAGEDIGKGIKVSSSDNLFLSMHTTGSDSLATPGACQTVNGGFRDGLLVKFGFQLDSITGPDTVCVFTTDTFSDPTHYGHWDVSDTAIATIDAGTGILTAHAPGSVIVSYILGAHYTTLPVYVYPYPTAGTIAGDSIACTGQTTLFNDSVGSGAWASSDTAVATIDSTGLLSGLTYGTTIISCTYHNRCGSASATKPVSVNPTPAGISGTSPLCAAVTDTVFSATPGGYWQIADTTIATVIGSSGSGTITGNTPGTSLISYTLAGCSTLDTVVVNPPPDAGLVSGSDTVCPGPSTTFSITSSGGSWSSSDPTIASISTTGGVSALSPGTAIISYILTDACGSDTATYPIVVPPPVTDTISGPATVCVGYSSTLTTTHTGPTWLSSNTGVATVSSSGLLTGISPGTATIIHFAAGSCGLSSTSKVVTVNTAPVAVAISGSSAICAGSLALLSATTTGGMWSSSDTTIATVSSSGIAAGLSPGVVTIHYTVSGTCGTAVASTTLTVNPAPDAGIVSGPAAICIAETYSLTTSVAGGTWSTSDAAVLAVSSSGSITGSAAGSAVTTYTVTNSCGTAYTTHVVSVNPLAYAGAISGATIMCEGAGVALTTSGSGGSWSSSNPTISTVSTSGIVSGISPGTAIVSYTATNSCGTSIAAYTITVNPAASAGPITGPATVCIDDSITLSSLPASGSWHTTDTGAASVSAAGVVTGITADTVTIYYTVTNSCGTAVATHVLTVNPAPVAGVISGPASVCAGSTISLSSTASGGSWSSSSPGIATVSSSGNLSGLSAGVTDITYTNSNSCGTAFTVQSATVNPVPDAGTLSGTDSICVGSFVSFSASAPGGTWASSAPTTAAVAGGTVTGIAAGAAIISYSVINSCGTAIAVSSLVVQPLPDAGTISGPSVVCAGSDITLTNYAAGGIWSSSYPAIGTISASGVVTGISNGTSVISFSTSSTCGTAFATKVVTVNPLPLAAVITGSPLICEGSTAGFTATLPGGAWQSSDTAVATISATGNVTGIAPGSTVISYTTANACGTALTSSLIHITPLPDTGTIAGLHAICPGATAALTTSATGGSWSSSAPAIAPVNAYGVVSGVSAGTAVISYTVSNSCGAVYATHLFTVNPAPSAGIISGPSQVCNGSNITLASPVSGGFWLCSPTAVATISSTGVVSAHSPGTAVVSYVATGSCGTAAAGRVVTVVAIPSPVSITGPSNTCVGMTAILSAATPGGTWISPYTSFATVTPLGTVLGISAGTTAIIYAFSNSCGTAYSSHALTVNPLPSAGTISGPVTVCSGDSIVLSASAPGGSWSSALPIVAVNSSTGSVTGISPGTANILYTVSGSCGSATAGHTVTVVPLPDTISGPTAACSGHSIVLSDSSPGGTWSATGAATIGSVSGVLIATAPGFASATYTMPSGCKVIGIVTVNIQPGPVSGGVNLCEGSTVTLTNSIPGGSWTGSGTTASIAPVSGLLTATAPGTFIVTYTLPDGCLSAAVLTINAVPAAISGPLRVCNGTSTMLTSASPGGSWTSSDTTIATVVSTSGFVNAIMAGTAQLTYTQPTGCSSTHLLTVDPMPAAITGITHTCAGDTSTLSCTPAGGMWMSGDSLTALPGVSGSIVGLTVGTAVISYVMPVSGCRSSAIITINPVPLITTSDTTICNGATITMLCADSTGNWSTSGTTIATIDSSTGILTSWAAGTVVITCSITATGCYDTATVAVNTQPGAITGPLSLCRGTTGGLSCLPAGGTWMSDLPMAAIDTFTGLLTANTPGIANITYALSSGCHSLAAITIDPTPSAIVGDTSLCVGDQKLYADTVTGGMWLSNDTSIISADFTGGLVSAIAPGTALLSYELPTGCLYHTSIIVHPLPDSISGDHKPCVGSSVYLTAGPMSGSWSALNTGIVSIDSVSGRLYGIATGTTLVSYISVNGCLVTTTLSVLDTPHTNNIEGDSVICPGTSNLLLCSAASGTWSSTPDTILYVSTSGIATGVRPGSAVISYSVSNKCGSATSLLKVVVPATIRAGSIGAPATICAGETTSLSYTGNPGMWTTANAAIATISNSGALTANAVGITSILYIVDGLCGTDTAEAVVAVTDCRDTHIRIYPNPTQGEFTIETYLPGEVWIYTIDGRLIVKQMNIDAGSTDITLPPELAAADYMLMFKTTTGQLITEKLVYRH